jgi:hypothetical protein
VSTPNTFSPGRTPGRMTPEETQEALRTGGAVLEHVNGSHTMRLARTVVQCSGCRQRFLILVELTLLDPPRRDLPVVPVGRLEAVAS